jgi:hypothetical protein
LIRELAPRLARGESLVVITPSLDAAWVEALMSPRMSAAARSVVLIETPAAPADRLSAVQTLLGELRIPTTTARAQSRLAALPAAPGSGDWEFIATPTGRVVARSRPGEALS